MAFTEKQDYQTEVTAPYSVIRVRRADIVLKDGEEVGRTYHRHQIVPCSIDDSDNIVDTDISKEPEQVKAICNAVFTTTVKDNYKTHLIASKPS